MKRMICLLFALSVLAANISAGDLYFVPVQSHAEALALEQADGKALLWVDGGYLVLLDAQPPEDSKRLRMSLLAADVAVENLAIDQSARRSDVAEHTILLERGSLRLVYVDNREVINKSRNLMPLRDRSVPIEYHAPKPAPKLSVQVLPSLDSLVSRIEQDSLQSYTERLQAFYRRLTGTDSCYAARDWIELKFQSFGYDSIEIDPFIGRQLWDRIPVQSYNVVAYKPGSVTPEQQIIIGGHFDAVPDCPGADDNASGTAGTLEIARVLADVDFPMTLIFIAFDSEESWLWGSEHYAETADQHGDDIVLMINLDMIAHGANSTDAHLHHGPDDTYAQLWDDLAPLYTNLTGWPMGPEASDQQPFIDRGWDGLFVQEYVFSDHYHLPSDSTTYFNFEYQTKMTKVSLALAYMVGTAPAPVRIADILDPGDGQSQLISWPSVDNPGLDHLQVSWFGVEPERPLQSMTIPPTDTSVLVTGLDDGVRYAFYVEAFDTLGRSGYTYDVAYGTPSLLPPQPFAVGAAPVYHGVRLDWKISTLPLDFDYYAIVRDGSIVAQTPDTFFIDTDPTLGDALHDYTVMSVDQDGNPSDTVGAETATMRAATLDPNRIYAVNRSSVNQSIQVDAVISGEFLRDALLGADFTYLSDTSFSSAAGSRTKLIDMVSYGTLIVADETGNNDALGSSPSQGGILEAIAYYLSIGGRVVVYGRFGKAPGGDSTDYTGGAAYDDAYADYFHIAKRGFAVTEMVSSPTSFIGDFVGANSLVPGYPSITWDSVRTAAHSDVIAMPSGIPMTSWVELYGSEAEPIYTYDSRTNDPMNEGRVVGWRHLDTDYRYVFLDIPLSFCDWETAQEVLHRAVNDVAGTPTDVDDNEPTVPRAFVLYQNYPNPFNPSTTIEYELPATAHVKLTIYNLLGRTVSTLVDETQKAGRHTVLWEGSDTGGDKVATGVYLYRIEAGDFVANKKMLLLR